MGWRNCQLLLHDLCLVFRVDYHAGRVPPALGWHQSPSVCNCVRIPTWFYALWSLSLGLSHQSGGLYSSHHSVEFCQDIMPCRLLPVPVKVWADGHSVCGAYHLCSHSPCSTVGTLLSPPPPTPPPPAWLSSKIVIHNSLCNGVQIAHDRRGKTFSHHPSSETRNNDIKVQREFLFTISMAKVFLVFTKAVLTSPCVWSWEQKFKNLTLTAIYEL